MQHIIIIGSGLGGLSAGVLLARNGYRVTILEQGAQPGGCLQCFDRQGVRFETGMHVVGSLDSGQVLSNYLNLLGVRDSLQFSRLDPQAYDIVSIQGRRYSFANGREAMIQQLCQQFPGHEDELRDYWRLVAEVAEATPYYTLDSAHSETLSPLHQQSIDQVLDRTISSPELRRVLVGNLPLYAPTLGRTPFATHAFVTDFYNHSAFRIVGGSQALANALVDQLQAHGGQIVTGCRVVRVACADGTVTHVVDDQGRSHQADIFISDIHPAHLVDLFAPHDLREAYRNRVTSLPNTTSVFSLYLRFKPESEPYLSSNFFAYRTTSPWDLNDYTPQSWPNGYLYMHHCDELNQQYARSAVVLAYMSQSELSQWADTTSGRRPSDYQAFKKQKAEQLIDALEEEFPGIRDRIDTYYTATPLTYRDYTLTPEGSMYGIAKDITLGAAGRVSYRTKLNNLFLVGQNINAHGILGVLVGSVGVCSHLLGEDQVRQQMIAANQPSVNTVVIGGGLGGLLTGALLAKNGRRVTVLEKNAIIGGGLQTFTRNGIPYPTGMHVFGGFQPGGQLHRICRYLGILDQLDLEYTDPDCFDEVIFLTSGRRYRLPQGREQYLAYLSQRFPHQAKGLQEYVDMMYRISEQEDLFYLRQPQADHMINPIEPFLWTADRLINEYISDPELRALLSYLAPLYAGRAGVTPAYEHALVNILHINGSAQFRHSSQQLADALADVIRRHGGQVLANTPVAQLEVSDRQAVQAVGPQGQTYPADEFVSSIDPTALLRITSDGAFPPSFRRRISEAPYTYSAFKLYLELAPHAVPHERHPRYYMCAADGNVWDADQVTLDQWPRCFMAVSHPAADGTYAQALTLIAPVSYQWFEPWADTHVGHRSADYQQFKERLADKLMQQLQQAEPATDWQQSVVRSHTSSPLTIRDYYGVPQGSLYGFQKDANHIMNTQLVVNTKVRNLYLTGQCVNLHGLCGVAITALSTAETILGPDTICRELREEDEGLGA